MTRLQIEINGGADIGPGFMILHHGSIIINGDVVAGEELTINHGVILGNQPMGRASGGAPRLGNRVRLGIDAKIIGDVFLGNGVQVGAGAVVTKSFGDNSVIAGVPAKLLYVLDDSEGRVITS